MALETILEQNIKLNKTCLLHITSDQWNSTFPDYQSWNQRYDQPLTGTLIYCISFKLQTFSNVTKALRTAGSFYREENHRALIKTKR